MPKRVGYKGRKKTTLYDTDWYKLGRLCLTGHTLYYRDYDDAGNVTGGHWSRQRMGQLMGSPMSFPILCLANATLTYTALSWSPDRIRA